MICLDLYISGMAWLYKHPRSQFWQIGWRVGNTMFNRSTKVTNRAEAEKKLALFDLMADANRERRLAFRQSDVQISVLPYFNGDGLNIRVRVRNLSSTQKMDFMTWHANSANDYKDYAKLTDNYNNNYKLYQDAVPQTSRSVYPSQEFQEDEFFELPVKNVQWLHLELPAKNIGGTGMIRFEIPATGIAQNIRQAIEGSAKMR